MVVLAYTEVHEGRLTERSRALLSYARRLAGMLGGEAVAFVPAVLGDEEQAVAGRCGASRLLLAGEGLPPFFDVTLHGRRYVEAAAHAGAQVLLFAYGAVGRMLAPYAAAVIRAGYVAGVRDLPLQTEPFVVRRSVYSGKVTEQAEILTERKVLMLAPHAWEEEHFDGVPVAEPFAGEPLPAGPLERVAAQPRREHRSLTDARVVVSGGRGMQAAENFRLLEELASLLGGAVACTRPVADEGWRPPEDHAGQTGKIIAPDLYFAFGISGAIQHMAGVSGSKVIAAVNTDPDAPIFEMADYGIVGDALEVLPRLIEAIRRRRKEG